MTTVYGLTIYLPIAVSGKPEIGIYTVAGGNSVIRLLEVPVDGVSDYTTGLICEGGIGAITETVDTSLGGGLAQVKGASVTLANTNQMLSRWSELGIALSGCMASITEFYNGGQTIVFTGVIEDVTGWTETELTFDIQAGLRLKRRANLSKFISGAAIYPVTFGYDAKSRFARDKNVIETLGIKDLLPMSVDPYVRTADEIARDCFLFPVNHVKETLVFCIKFTSDMFDQMVYIPTPENMYVSLVSGAGSGDTRKITRIVSVMNVSGAVEVGYSLEITVDNNFVEPLSASGLTQTWCKILRIDTQYTLDLWNCRGVVGQDTGAPTANPAIYSYTNDTYMKVGNLGTLKPAGVDATPSNININPAYSDVAKGTFDGFNIIPLSNIALQSSASFSVLGLLGSYTKVVDGLYRSTAAGENYDHADSVVSFSSGAGALVSDGDLATMATFSLTNNTFRDTKSTSYCISFEIDPPEIDKNINFDEVYLGLALQSCVRPNVDSVNIYDEGIRLYVLGVPLSGSEEIIYDGTAYQGYSDIDIAKNSSSILDYAQVNNLPDAYTRTSTNNTNFYLNSTDTALTTGYKRFKLSMATDVESYYKLRKIRIVLVRHISMIHVYTPYYTYFDKVSIKETALLFKTSADYKDSIYTPAKGRTWGIPLVNGVVINNERSIFSFRASPPDGADYKYVVDEGATGSWSGHDWEYATWNGTAWVFTVPEIGDRIYVQLIGCVYDWNGESWVEQYGRATAELVENPIDILEHVLRLQNGAENCTEPTDGWGKSYWNDALINTRIGDDRSFKSSHLGTVKDLTIARQIRSESDAYTDAVTNSICKDFYLINSQNNYGEECVSYLLDETAAVDTITLGDIVGPVGDMEEPKLQNIFIEPVINYNYDQGSEKYLSTLSIKGVSKAAPEADDISGFTGDDGVTLWTALHALWPKVNQIEPMPSALSDQKWVKTYPVALWKLTKVIEWMTKKRCSFTVPYTTGKLWYVGKKIAILLPHQTNSSAVQCVIESVSKDKNRNTVKVFIILLTEISTTFYTSLKYQGTYTNISSLLDWQKIYINHVDNGGSLDDVQNTYKGAV